LSFLHETFCGARVTLDAFSAGEILLIVVVIAASAFMHGIIGFGFPIMAMPVLATAFDTKTAVLLTVVPIVALTLISSVRGGRLRQSVGRFWFLPVFTALGGAVGTRLFLVAPTSLLTLLLAIFILVYLLLDRYGPGRFEFVHRHWVPFAAVFAFGAGITETTVNIGVPLILIYFMLAGVETLAMVQALNFVFLFSKLVQVGTLIGSGTLPLESVAALSPLILAAVVPLFAGMRIRDRFDVATYRRALRIFLWIAAALLFARWAQEALFAAPGPQTHGQIAQRFVAARPAHEGDAYRAAVDGSRR
jgi:uncharacterized membrane protein YfcA